MQRDTQTTLTQTDTHQPANSKQKLNMSAHHLNSEKLKFQKHKKKKTSKQAIKITRTNQRTAEDSHVTNQDKVVIPEAS